MAEFVCTLCGRCCMGMGKYVKIAGVMGNQVIARHEIGKETFHATIERAYRDDFDPDDESPDHPEWCPFLRQIEGEEQYVCIIHATRPQFCRDFVCCRMRIYSTDGRVLGRVRGTTLLSTTDTGLQELWDREMSRLSTENDAEWMEQVRERLETDGYVVEIYD